MVEDIRMLAGLVRGMVVINLCDKLHTFMVMKPGLKYTNALSHY